MGYTVPTAYPSTTALDIVIGHTPIGTEWVGSSGVVRRQHFVYRHRRTTIVSKNFERVRWTFATKLGFVSNDVLEGTAFLFIPDTSSLWTPDDYDADVQIVARAYYAVTGAAGNGTVRVNMYWNAGANTELQNITKAAVPAVAPFAWASATFTTVDKNLTALGIGFRLLVDNVAATVECRKLHVYVEEQGSVGV